MILYYYINNNFYKIKNFNNNHNRLIINFFKELINDDKN